MSTHALDRVQCSLHHLVQTRELLHDIDEGFELLRHIVELGGEFLDRGRHLQLNLQRLADGARAVRRRKIFPLQINGADTNCHVLDKIVTDN